jgi:hypothetical protein
MQRVSEFELYELATHIHKFTELPDEGLNYRGVWWDWFNARTALNQIFKQRSLEFSLQAATKLFQMITEVVPLEFDAAIAKYAKALEEARTREEELNADTDDISISQINNIRKAALDFETILRTELDNADTYFIMPKGSHKTSVLLYNAHRELPSYVTTEHPEVIEDFNEAGKCMLFNSGTAAGFHLLRATETVIRKYLVTTTGKEVPAKTRNWGAYIKILNNHGARPQITGILHHIKEIYRNPILHPEVLLKPEDAPVLFGLCVSAIIVMANEIKMLKEKSGTLAFPVTGGTMLGA